MNPQKNYTYYYIALGSIAVVAISAFFVLRSHSIEITNLIKGDTATALGATCDPHKRPLAVMVSSDPEARPLSAIADADIVFEMPVTPDGITRMMTVFQCTEPKEIGSIRSSRLDFVPLAQGLNAIYAHWGGEHTVLEELNKGIIDNLDGLKYDGTTFFRKQGIPAPHNGFTSYSALSELISRKNYSTTTATEGYKFDTKDKSLGTEAPTAIYAGQMTVSWRYDAEKNSYLRTRNSQSEIDRTSNQQVNVKNVVLMKTTQTPLEGQYIRVKTIGTGTATIYKNGQAIQGTWKKDSATAKLYFYDQQGDEINFTPGRIWIEIVT